MRMSSARLALVGALVLLVLPLTAGANNNAPENAHSIMVGGTPVEGFTSATSPDRWYLTTMFANRSYCAETQSAPFFETGAGAGLVDTLLTLYRNNPTTLLADSDDIHTEPNGAFLSRVCFIAPAVPASQTLYIKVSRLQTAVFNFRMRVVETTLFSNWFFLGGDYNAYTIIRNTTRDPVDVIVRWRSLAGVVLATRVTSVVGNGGLYLNARDIVPSPATNQTGNVEITHTGSPQAIMATATILSATTGLSFDTLFTQREPW